MVGMRIIQSGCWICDGGRQERWKSHPPGGSRKLGGYVQKQGRVTIKKNEIMPSVATWMDLESVILRDVSQTEKEKYHMTSLACGIYHDTNELIYETDLQT